MTMPRCYDQPGPLFTGTAGVSPASSSGFTPGRVNPFTQTQWHSTLAGETPAVPVKSGLVDIAG